MHLWPFAVSYTSWHQRTFSQIFSSLKNCPLELSVLQEVAYKHCFWRFIPHSLGVAWETDLRMLKYQRKTYNLRSQPHPWKHLFLMILSYIREIQDLDASQLWLKNQNIVCTCLPQVDVFQLVCDFVLASILGSSNPSMPIYDSHPQNLNLQYFLVI